MISLNMRILLTLLLMLILTIIPMPAILQNFRLPWVLLFVLYIQFFLPKYFSLSLLIFLGLYLDVLLSTIFGEHTFALVITSWFAATKARRFPFFSMLQQMLMVAGFCFLYQIIIYIIDAFLGYHAQLYMLLFPSLLTLFFWPWIRVLADYALCYNSPI